MASKFNFDEVLDRRDTNSIKWKVAENELPVSIADMEFEAAPVIIEALKEAVDAKLYGYSYVPDSTFEAIVDWQARRHNVEIEKKEILFTTGVLAGIKSVIKELTEEGEGIIVLTPTYNNFFIMAMEHNRDIAIAELKDEGGVFSIDWAKLEEVMKDPNNKLLLTSNPHNPIGRFYTKDEMERILKLADEHDVYVVFDEIHSDLTHIGKEHVSSLTVNPEYTDRLIEFNSISKSFNLAGMKLAYAVIKNSKLRGRLQKAFEKDNVHDSHFFVPYLIEAAYSQEGEEWLDALREYISENRKYLIETLSERLPDLVFSESSGTYLEWINTINYAQDSKHLSDYARYKTGLILNAGEAYGFEGRKYLRFNYACPRPQLDDAINRFVEAVEGYQELGIDYMPTL